MSRLPRLTGPFYVCSRSTDLVTHFAGTEAHLMARALLENTELFFKSEEDALSKAVESLEHKRSKEQIKAWWRNLKDYYQKEKTWTVAVEKYIREEDKKRLLDLILRSIDDGASTTSLVDSKGAVEAGEVTIEEQKTEDDDYIRTPESLENIPGVDEETHLSPSSTDSTEDGEDGDDSLEKTIHETILKLYTELSTEGQERVRRAIEQVA